MKRKNVIEALKKKATVVSIRKVFPDADLDANTVKGK